MPDGQSKSDRKLKGDQSSINKQGMGAQPGPLKIYERTDEMLKFSEEIRLGPLVHPQGLNRCFAYDAPPPTDVVCRNCLVRQEPIENCVNCGEPIEEAVYA
jgi:hypothetical protein